MKSAKERAEAEWGALPESAQVAIRKDVFISLLTLSFKEHARDQRRLCAEAAGEAWRFDGAASVRNPAPIAHGAAANAPAPGEGR